MKFSRLVVDRDTFSTLAPALERQQQNNQAMSLSFTFRGAHYDAKRDACYIGKDNPAFS